VKKKKKQLANRVANMIWDEEREKQLKRQEDN
jgi:hypothetical protein